MVNTRSGDTHQAETNETSAAAAAAAAAARNDDDFVDADDNHQDSAQPEQAATDQGTRSGPSRRAASPRPAGRGNRGRSQRRGGSAPPSRNQSPQHQQPPRQNPTSNTRYDITNHERGEVRRMLIRNPPPSFEPTQAWFAAMYANLKLTGIEALARVRFTGENLISLASILHSTIQAACASSPEASLIVETAEDAVAACSALEKRFVPTDARAESNATDRIAAVKQLNGQPFEEFAAAFVKRRTDLTGIYLNRLMHRHLHTTHAILMDHTAQLTAHPSTTMAQIDAAIASARRAARTELAAAHPEHTAIQTLIARMIPTSSCSRDTLFNRRRMRVGKIGIDRLLWE
ncbi:hypothetical protein NFJ02_09g139810 [Pycnococcus provasolii]